MSLRETLDKIRSVGTPTNEEAAKFQIIAPILRDLGWDPFGPDVLYKHPVGGGEGSSVDIALRGPIDLVALIKVKAPGIDLRRHESQVLRYAHYEGVDICVLTNGLEWWLYLPLDREAPEKLRFTTLHIKDDPIEQLADDLETFLGEKNLVDGQAQKRAKQKVLEASRQAAFLDTELPKIWQTMLDGPDDDLVELVRQRTYKKVKLHPDKEQVVAMLKRSPATPMVPDISVSPTSIPPKTPKLTGFRLWDRLYNVRYGTEMYVRTAGLLHQKYGQEFINRLLNLQTPGGKPYAYRYDSQEEHVLRSKKIPGTDIYLDTNLKIEIFKERAHEFLNLFGHPPSDLKIFYE